jgi:hypothetical protein
MGIKKFYDTAHAMPVVTDKVVKHRYQLLYGRYLLPLGEAREKNGVPIKMLEIGLGCNMQYGSGASVALWKRLFGPTAQLWEADYMLNA